MLIKNTNTIKKILIVYFSDEPWCDGFQTKLQNTYMTCQITKHLHVLHECHKKLSVGIVNILSKVHHYVFSIWQKVIDEYYNIHWAQNMTSAFSENMCTRKHARTHAHIQLYIWTFCYHRRDINLYFSEDKF